MEKYINLKNYKTSCDIDGYILCDPEIMKVIPIINQKGYKTLYSYAEH